MLSWKQGLNIYQGRRKDINAPRIRQAASSRHRAGKRPGHCGGQCRALGVMRLGGSRQWWGRADVNSQEDGVEPTV